MKLDIRDGESVGPLLSLDAAISTGEGDRFTLAQPLSQFGLQVVSTGSVTVTLRGSAASSSDAALTTLATWNSTGQTSGDTIFATGSPCAQLAAVLDAASTAAPASAWITAAR